jgi:hypothetical protein
MPKGIIWTAVISALAGATCLILAFLDNYPMSNAFGFVALTSALLATRER